MGTTAEKINYAINATNDIAEGINNIGGNITQNTELADFREELDKLYSEMPKTSSEGISITLANTRRGKIGITPKGNTIQTQLTGKNLCDISLLPITQYGITISKNSNGNIIINGTPDYSDGYKSFRIGTDRTIPAGQYSVSIDTKINGIGFANGIPYANLSMGDTVRVKTTTTSENSTITPIINISYDVGTLNNFILNPQVEAGTPTDYEPYTGGQPSPNPDYPQDIKVVTGENNVIIRGRNLSEIDRNDSNNNPKTIGGLTYNFNKNTITVNGTATASATGISFILKRRFKPGTYTISGLPNKEVGSNDRGTVYIWNDTTPNTGLSNPDETKTNIYNKTTVTIEKDSYIGFRIISNNTSTGLEYNQTYNIQIEQGSTATTYEPYIEPITKELNLGNIELAKIVDYSDLIFKNEKSSQYYNSTLTENAWYKKKYIGKITLNGTENPTLNIDSANTIRCYYNYDLLEENAIQNQGLCNRLSYVSNWSQDVEGFYYNNNSKKLIFRMLKATIGTTKTSVNAWLSNNPTKFYYVLATPTDSQITDTTLINQLEELNQVIGNGGTVIIETESDEENARLIVNASALASFENE